MDFKDTIKVKFHLPGLFEFYDFYKVFLPLYAEHREYFYDIAEIGSVYGAPSGCIWAGGRMEVSDTKAEEVLALLREYGIAARLTFSNSRLNGEHLSDMTCNRLCEQFESMQDMRNGVIVHSDLLMDHIRKNYPGLTIASSTTKVLTEFRQLKAELGREEFTYVVPDFRLNKRLEELSGLSAQEKKKVEFLCNECCYVGCQDRKECYETVSRQMLDDSVPDHICRSPGGSDGYRFSTAMESPAFISIQDILNWYLPNGFTNFKIEGRSLGSAMILEFLLYYMIRPECQLKVREHIYLDSMLDLF